MQSDGIPGLSIELAKQGNVIYAQAYGYADVGACTPVQSDTPFRLASLTKAFTATAMLQLQNSGVLDLDATVISYLPAYAFDPRITVRMLLNHISGLADYVNQPALFPQDSSWELQGVAEPTVLTAIAQAPLQFTPGAQYQYSNSNYFILGCILETLTSQTYLDYLSANIFKPASLTDTSTTQPAGAALPYSVSAAQAPVEFAIWNSSSIFSVGALWSNVQDLTKFDAALFSGQLLPSAQFMEMVTPPSTPATSYAMGWARTTLLNRPFVLHDGALPGVSTFNGMFLDDGLSITLLMNANPSTLIDNFAMQVIQTVCAAAPAQC